MCPPRPGKCAAMDGQKRPRGFHSRPKCVGKKTNALYRKAVLIKIKKAGQPWEGECLPVSYCSCQAVMYFFGLPAFFTRADQKVTVLNLLLLSTRNARSAGACHDNLSARKLLYCPNEKKKIVRGRIAYNVLRTGLVPPSVNLNVQMSAETYKTQMRGIRLVRCYKLCAPHRDL